MSILNLPQEVRLTFRRLRKAPSFTITALLTLSVGISVTVMIFGVLHGLLLTPLNVRDPGQLYSVEHGNDLNSSYPDYKDLRDRNKSFSGLALMRIVHIGLGTSNGTDAVWGYEVSGNYFDTLGLQPFLGRFLQPSDEHGKDANPALVLSYSCWHTRFAGAPNIVGQTVYVSKLPYTVIGVAPEGFFGTERIFQSELWLPVLNEQSLEDFNWIDAREARNAWLIGRVKPDVSPQRAEAELKSIASQMAREHPRSEVPTDYQLSQPGLLGNTLGGPVRGLLSGIMLLAFLQLIAACANLGALFATRTSDRAPELALRVALGSSRSGIFRELVLEALMVAFIACIFAMAVAQFLLKSLSHWRPLSELPIRLDAEPGISVYLFALLAAVGSGLLFGAISARSVWSIDPNLALRNAVRNPLVGRRFAIRDLVLGMQIMVGSLLVTACFVAVDGLQKSAAAPLGFNTEGVYLASFDLRLASYKDAQAPIVQKRLLDAVLALPGVTGAAYGNAMPLGLDQSNTTLVPESAGAFGSATNRAFANKSRATYYQISPGYLQVSTLRLIAGRDFTWEDNATTRKVAIISRSLAARLEGSKTPIGQRFFSMAQGAEPWEIVGVIDDGRYQTFNHDADAVFYPILQVPSTSTVLAARTSLTPGEIIPEMRQAISRVDAGIPLFSVSSWTDSLGFVLLPGRAVASALAVFGVIAILLAVTGIFGLASNSVRQRLRDVAIRIALGGRPFQIVRIVLMRTAILLTAGSTTGFLLGYAAGKVIAGIVYQSNTNVGWVLMMAVMTMFFAGAIAVSLPLKRALAARPMDLLRAE